MSIPSIYDFKPRFQRSLHPILDWLAKKHITANMVTYSALFGSILVGVGIGIFGPNSIVIISVLPAWLFMRMALNAIDGMMAREYKTVSDFGFVLNETGDVLSDVFLYFPLSFLFRDALLPVYIFCIGAILTEFCGIIPKALGFNRRYDGPMGKSDRAFWIGTLSIITLIYPAAAKWWKYAFIIMALLEIVTCVKRTSNGLKGDNK